MSNDVARQLTDAYRAARRGADGPVLPLELFRDLLDQVDDAVEIVDPNTGRFIDGNRKAWETLGYTREEFANLTIPDINPTVDSTRVKQHIAHLRSTGRNVVLEARHRRKDGSEFPVEINTQLVGFDREYVVAIVRDTTERRRVEVALQQSEERFRLVGEATRDVVWDWDLTTGACWWSPHAADRFGQDLAKPTLETWLARMHPDDRQRVAQSLEAALAGTGLSWNDEFRYRLADDSWGHFIDRGHIVRNEAGRAMRMVGAIVDVTESKQAYASLAAAYDQLQAASRELQTVEANERRRLARELHDEMGQLLTALKFDLQSLRLAAEKHDGPGQLQERVVEAFNTTNLLFTRLNHLVHALRPPAVEELGLVDALQDLVNEVRRHTGLPCSLSIHCPQQLRQPSPSVETAVYRIAQELLTNAVRHAAASCVAVKLSFEWDACALTVTDDGVGFDPRCASKEGWGLRGIRERVTVLGGRMSIDTAPGRGTTVTAELSIHAGDPAWASTQRGVASPPSTITVSTVPPSLRNTDAD
ncbi:MAG: PAS domain S-box protein [Vicinamibacterales bacterium]